MECDMVAQLDGRPGEVRKAVGSSPTLVTSVGSSVAEQLVAVQQVGGSIPPLHSLVW